jgi:DNA-binding NarL/FixJ family response regulator
MKRRRIRVGLADHHPIFRGGLARCVSECEDIELVAETSDGVTTLARLRQHRPDIAVVDRDLPGLDAASIATTARLEGLPTRVVVLADVVDGPGVHAALRAGAAAYMGKDTAAADVTDALRAVAAGEVVLTSHAMTCLGREIRLRHRSDRPWLTDRERQILGLVAEDSTTAEIAGAAPQRGDGQVARTRRVPEARRLRPRVGRRRGHAARADRVRCTNAFASSWRTLTRCSSRVWRAAFVTSGPTWRSSHPSATDAWRCAGSASCDRTWRSSSTICRPCRACACLMAVMRDSLPTRVLFLSARSDGDAVHTAIEMGAAGWLSKVACDTRIAEAILAVHRGEIVVWPALYAGLADEIATRAGHEPPLTPRERQVLELVAGGCTVKRVAVELGMSRSTVKTHLAHLYDKFGISSQAAAVAEAMRRGLIQ